MQIGVPKETAARERRVALVPDVVRRLRAAEHDVVVERGAGLTAGATDEAYEAAGATFGDPWGADVIVKVAPPSADEIAKLAAATTLVGFLNPSVTRTVSRRSPPPERRRWRWRRSRASAARSRWTL